MQTQNNKANRRSGVCPRRGASTSRIVILVVLVVAVGAGIFEFVQWNRRNSVEAALAKYDLNPKRDPNNPKKIISTPDPDAKPASRETIHEEVFGGAEPTEVSEIGRMMLKESWTFPGVFTNYVVDVNYNLVTEGLVDPESEEGKNQKYLYIFDRTETRNVSHFASGDLIANKAFSRRPNLTPVELVGVGGPGGNGDVGSQGGGNQGAGNDDGDDQSDDNKSGDDQAGDGQTDDDQSRDAKDGDDQSGDDEPPVTAPPSGDDKQGDGGSDDDGSDDDQQGGNGSGGDL